ncbi:hypothetical protein SERLA73DRAFT_174199 [Serpula lacrymans var. lacrymans S7.3]|uniref:Uncharacterized protein n=2 Tax=Serpula lacrymans var. lacrymans TaxID=341189 RepID=F8PIF8_SERL3|nr:uncharacterized protein SERLADRAFT_455316 [Serpula lacrymans var. lacrymans S7.9]EGO05201.1 hypothetical protein SERLA73DRAFT_174199 [Serpula lacrymans var. lacrymans S7.3]EGO30941.1 hypothetical protein SERLADRAFT_455316 [Serpula lacrymans var. lacrymans S7.9]
MAYVTSRPFGNLLAPFQKTCRPHDMSLESPQLFGFGTRLGLVFIVELASLSAIAVTSLLSYVAYSAITINRNASRRWSTETHIHYYFLNLMVFDLIQAIGGIMDIRWIVEAQVTAGSFCTTQGLFKQMGDVGVAMSTIAIALHTLQVLVFRWTSAPRTALVVLLVIWIVVALMVGVPNAVQDQYYGPTGYWCWIKRDNFERIGLEYLWLWIAAFINIVVYVFLALVVRGIIVIDGLTIRWPRNRPRRRQNRDSTDSQHPLGKDESAIAVQMLFYPAVYIITVLPIAAARFSEFHSNNVPFGVTAFADSLFASSGLFNTILYALTRPKLLPRRSRPVSSFMLASGTSVRFRHSRSQGHMSKDYETGTLTDLDVSESSQDPSGSVRLSR